MKRYMVTLTAEERRALQALIAASKASARKLTHARILLKADRGPEGPGWNDEQITEGLGVGHATVDRVRQSRRAGTGGSDGGVGVCRHRFRGDRASDAQKNELKPWLKKQGCIPPKENAEFVWKREDVLDVYKRPYDPNRPMVCLDETSKQLIGETRIPVSAMPGREARYDHEYQRNGTANLFMVFEPLAGKGHVQVTERRTKKDWAGCVREVVDEMYPAAERIVLVMDNLNTHTPVSLYEAFPADEAKRIADRLEIHYTPKLGSWLDMAEIELGILGRQCLDQRIDNAEAITREIAVWEAERNAVKAKVNWRFTTDEARIKLKKLYPSIEE